MPAVAIIVALDHHSGPEQHVSALARQTTDISQVEAILLDGTPDCIHRDRVTRAIETLDGRTDVRYVPVPRAGRSQAWNRGILETSAPLLLFLGDDFFARPALVQTHLELHAQRPERNVAGIGPGTFPPGLPVTPFMRWLEDSGRLYGASFTRPDPDALTRFFYGGNTSLKREFLESVGLFDERYPYASFDDWEMGLRLFRAGMEVVYLPQALADHDHPMTLRERAEAVRRTGRSAALFEVDHPGPHEWDGIVRHSAARMWMWAGRRWLRRVMRPSDETRAGWYDARLRVAFAAGYRRADRRTRRAPTRAHSRPADFTSELDPSGPTPSTAGR